MKHIPKRLRFNKPKQIRSPHQVFCGPIGAGSAGRVTDGKAPSFRAELLDFCGRCGVLLFAFSLLFLPSSTFAGSDPSLRITDLTYRIALDSSDSSLLIERGMMLHISGYQKEALHDFERAAALDGTADEADFGRGLALLALNRPAEGKVHLDRFLAVYPDDAQVRATRARTLVALGDNLGAAADYTRVIVHSPAPDYYGERARALAAAGQFDDALRGLDQGHKRLGMLVSLESLAIDLELARNNIDGAVARVDSMAAITGRSDIWLARRGDILLQAGRHDDAHAAYGQALATIGTLSPRRQGSKIVRDLKTRLEALLQQTTATENTSISRPGETPAPQLQ